MARRRYQAQAFDPRFDPRMVPEVAAGYFWRASRTTGFGTTGFRVVEGNGRSTFDLIQSTVAAQPTVLTENGCAQFRMREDGNANPSRLFTSGAVSVGWTGPTYIACWVRLPDASGDTTGVGNSFIRHNTTTGNQRRLTFSISNATPDILQSQPSTDGTAQAANFAQLASPTDGSWQYLELIFDFALALGGSSPTDLVKFFKNLVRLSPLTATPSVGLTQLFDASSQIFAFCATTTANADTTDWSALYYANGIPSLFNRQRLMALEAPIAVSF